MDLFFGGVEAEVADVEGGRGGELGFEVGGFGARGFVVGVVAGAGVAFAFLVLGVVRGKLEERCDGGLLCLWRMMRACLVFRLCSAFGREAFWVCCLC